MDDSFGGGGRGTRCGKFALHQGHTDENRFETDQDAPHQKSGFTETAASTNDARGLPSRACTPHEGCA